jgi:glycerol kinase
MIFDKSGAVIAIAQKEHQQFTPHPGWVEHDAGEIWQNTQSVIKEAISAAEKKARSGFDRDKRHRHHQSTRNNCGLGCADR